MRLVSILFRLPVRIPVGLWRHLQESRREPDPVWRVATRQQRTEPSTASLLAGYLIVIGGVALAVRYRSQIGAAWALVVPFLGLWWAEILTAAGVTIAVVWWCVHRSGWPETRAEPLWGSRLKPLSGWLLAGSGGVVVMVGGLTLWLLLNEANKASPEDQVALRIDAIKTTLITSGVLSGIQGLMLAARQRWLTEHKEVSTSSTQTRPSAPNSA